MDTTINKEYNELNKTIVCNNCCGASYYQYNSYKYNNPFMWTIVPYKSMIKLMSEWDSINWFNIGIKKSTIRKHTFIITVDDKVEIHYVHHLFDPNAVTPTTSMYKHSRNLSYNRIWEYITDMYLRRVKEMTSKRLEPCFLIHPDAIANDSGLEIFSDVATKYKTLFILDAKNNFTVNCSGPIHTIYDDKRYRPMLTIERNNETIKKVFG